MIHGIVIIIYKYHVYYQESLVIYKNTIFLELIIDVEPVDIIICVVSGLCTLYLPWPFFGHGDLNLNKLGKSFFSNI